MRNRTDRDFIDFIALCRDIFVGGTLAVIEVVGLVAFVACMLLLADLAGRGVAP